MMADSRGATVRPVETNFVARRAAKQLGHGDAQGLGFNIHQGAFHAGHGLGGNTAWTLAQGPPHVPETCLKGPWVLTNEGRLQIGDSANHTVGCAAITALAP